MAAPYIPPKDADLLAFANTYATTVAAAPAVYGLTSSDATAINTAVATYAAAQAVVDNPATKSQTTVNAKNSAKQAMIGLLRTYSAQIRLNPGVTNDAKLAIGLNLPNNTPTPTPPPITVPQLTVVGQQAGTITLRYHDSGSGANVRAKPQGAISCEVWWAVGTFTAPPTPGVAPTLKAASATKQPIPLTWPSGSAGMTYYIWARWITRTGLVGSWSDPVTGTVI